MALTRLCSVEELGKGRMESSIVDGWEILIVRDNNGVVHALDGSCPHEDFPLVYGDLDGFVLTCANHFWRFDVSTGRGINPTSCRLRKYHVEEIGDDIYVDGQREIEPPSTDRG